ncbi:MAG TPA: DUF3145 family protein [Streptosporangiaceae bacterium]
MSVRGVLQIHSAPPALSPHIEWAVAGVIGAAVTMPWVNQPAAPGTLRAELSWQARSGSAAAITSALAAWNRLRFEVTEEASPGCDPVRFSYTPSLGTFSAVTSANGDILISEGRLRAAMTLAAVPAPAPDGMDTLRSRHGPRHPALGGSLEAELALLLGQPWDDELEPFRHAAEGAPVRWLHATG